MILVTGSSGFIGSNFIKFLIEKNKSFHGIDLKPSKYLKFKNFSKIDLASPKKVNNFFKKNKPSSVVHLAAISGVNICHQNQDLAFKNNILATYNILKASKKYNCQKVLIASSFAVEKFSSNPNFYASTKKTCEDMIKVYAKSYGLNVAAVRFSNVYGPYSIHKSSSIHQMIKCLIKKKTFEIHGTGKQVRDFIYVDEIINKLNNLIRKKLSKLTYNFDTKKKISINSIINIINSIYKKKKLKTIHVKAPAGYDVSISKEIKKNSSRNLILNLIKTINWYNSEII